MGILIPPCLIMVIIAQIAGLSTGALFMAGFVPSVVLALAVMILIYVQARRGHIGGEARASLAEILVAMKRALIPLMTPVIIFGAILGGIADPTEAAVLAVAYAFVVGVFVYKEIRWDQLPKIIIDSAVTSGIVIFMVGAASSFSWILAFEQVPAELARMMLDLSDSPFVFFVISMVVFILLGAVLEGLPAIIICLPIFLPIAKSFGIDPLHYATMVVAATGIGLFLPPVGIGLYIASSFANLRADQTFRAMTPYVGVLVSWHDHPHRFPVAHPRRPKRGVRAMIATGAHRHDTTRNVFTRRQAMAAGLAALGSGALGASAGSPRALAQAPAIVKLPRKITIKAATIVAESFPYVDGLKLFKKTIEDKTAGDVEFQIFHSAQLGTSGRSTKVSLPDPSSSVSGPAPGPASCPPTTWWSCHSFCVT